VNNHHVAQDEHQAGQDGCRIHGSNGGVHRGRIDDDHDAGRNDGVGYSRGRGQGARERFSVSFFLKVGNEDRSKGGNIAQRASADPTKDGCGDELRLSQPSGKLSNNRFRPFDEPIGEARAVHEIAGQNIERNTDEDKGIDPLEDPDHQHREEIETRIDEKIDHSRDPHGDRDRLTYQQEKNED